MNALLLSGWSEEAESMDPVSTVSTVFFTMAPLACYEYLA